MRALSRLAVHAVLMAEGNENSWQIEVGFSIYRNPFQGRLAQLARALHSHGIAGDTVFQKVSTKFRSQLQKSPLYTEKKVVGQVSGRVRRFPVISGGYLPDLLPEQKVLTATKIEV